MFISSFTQISNIVIAIEACALIAAALSGFIEARKKRLDIVSTFIVGFSSAFGGGTMRDILLDRRPFYWVMHENYAILVFIMALIAPFLIRISSKWINALLYTSIDAIGLSLFTISGTSIALSMGSPPFAAIILGVVSAVFGGIIRDILLNQIPYVLKNNTPYISCAFVGACLYVLLHRFNILNADTIHLLIATMVIFILRMLSWHFNIRLPKNI
jgi:uncharacterized membrane protein YeiH